MSLNLLSHKLEGWIRIGSSGGNFIFLFSFFQLHYLKIRKCQASAQRGWNISVTESRLKWHSVVQSVLQLRNCLKIGKRRTDRRRIWLSIVNLKVFKQKKLNVFPRFVCLPSSLWPFAWILFSQLKLVCSYWHLPSFRICFFRHCSSIHICQYFWQSFIIRIRDTAWYTASIEMEL